jgi:hypothetical protein
MVNRAEASTVCRPPIAITTGPPISVPSAEEGVVSAVRVASTLLRRWGGLDRWNSSVQIALNGP